MLAKKELQGRQLMKMKTPFMPHPASMTPSRTAMPSGARSSVTPSASRAPSMSSTPSRIAPRTTDLSKTSILQGQAARKHSSSTVSMVANQTLSATVCMALATSSETVLARNPTLLQMMEFM
jgi:hypothetical protein